MEKNKQQQVEEILESMEDDFDIDDLDSEEEMALKQKAYNAATKYLALTPRSEKEVRERLYKKEFHKSQVDYAIEKCKQYNYINDREYVRAYIRSYKNKWGSNKMLYNLVNTKGVSRQVAEEVMKEDYLYEDQLEIAYKIAERYCNTKKITKENRQKVTQYLYQKGYSSSVMNAVMNKLFKEDIFFTGD